MDKEILEGLNSEIDRLKDLASHNSAVMTRLIETIGEGMTLEGIRDQKRRTEEAIRKTETIFRLDLARLLAEVHDVDPSDPFSHWRVQELKKRTDDNLAVLLPKLVSIEDLVTRVEAILQEFKPSGLKPSETWTPKAITREKVGGMV